MKASQVARIAFFAWSLCACAPNPDVCVFQEDRDGDGYPGIGREDRVVVVSDGRCPEGSYSSGHLDDCDDDNPAVHPEAVETCGVDLDCDTFFDPCPLPEIKEVVPEPATSPQI